MHTALLTTPYEQTGSTLTMLQAVIADKGESTYRMLYRIERTMLGGGTPCYYLRLCVYLIGWYPE